MPIDFNNPTTTRNYSTQFTQDITNAFKALGVWLDPTYAGTLTNTPTGAKRLNGGVFEQYNGSSWAAISMGFPTLTGGGASGSWGISITGSAASATSAGTANNLAGGGAGQVSYQSAAGATSFLAAGAATQVMIGGASAPAWANISGLSVASAALAAALSGGAAGQIHYQSGAGASAFLAAGAATQVLVGGASAPAWANISGLSVSYAATAGNITAYTINQSLGTSNSPTFVNVTTTSDRRLKESVNTLEGALRMVNAMRGVRYQWRRGIPAVALVAGEWDIGVIAQELKRVNPLLVGETKIGEEAYLTVNYDKIVPVLIEAIKTLTGRLEDLERVMKS